MGPPSTPDAVQLELSFAPPAVVLVGIAELGRPGLARSRVPSPPPALTEDELAGDQLVPGAELRGAG